MYATVRTPEVWPLAQVIEDEGHLPSKATAEYSSSICKRWEIDLSSYKCGAL